MFKPSVNQQRVLDTVNKNILVSASAGTGKTTVMIEKIAGLVQGKKASLKQLLVVTFTEMAAYEMKKRLVNKLSSSTDEEVLGQLSQIDTCAISTLHSFCSNLIRKYFVEAGIDPAYKILSDTEWLIAFDKIVDDCFDDYYKQADDGFLQLVEIFGHGRRDDGLRDLVKRLYQFKTCKSNFDEWFDGVKAKYKVENGQNFFTLQENAVLIKNLQNIRRQFDDLAAQANSLGLAKISLHFAELSASIFVSPNKDLRQNVAELQQIEFATFNTPRNLQGEELDFVNKCKEIRNSAKDYIKGKQSVYSVLPYDEMLAAMTRSFDCCTKIFEIVGKTEEKFDAFKAQNAYLDFNDLEHKALKVLSFGNIAEEVRQTYKYIFVDEYQDINEIQEEIISAVKGKDNLFMVGDVKQSIYAFRQCAPDIFVNKMDDFGKDLSANHVEYLNDNFRSDSEILSFVNHIFKHVMSVDFGGIDYFNTSMLKGENSSKSNLPAVSVEVINYAKQEAVADKPYSVRQKATPSITAAKAEAQLIAKRIRELVGLKVNVNGEEKTITYGDIVILSRVFKGHAKDVVGQLQAMDIPVVYSARQSLFDSAEMKEILNLFKVADNFYRDVPLAGCLLGKFCGLDENQLTRVCTSGNGDSLWSKSLDFAATQKGDAAEKLNKFIDFVQKIKFLASSMTVSRLIAKIFEETDFSLWVLGLPDGAVRLKKLNEFSDSLKDKSYNSCIAEFLSFTEAAAAEAEVASSSEANAVRAMTIHKSKGLEFPVVFVINCGQKFNLKTDGIVCDKQFGIAAKAYDLIERKESDTLSRSFIADAAKDRMRQEEMRILYVAMTRAKCHLYLTGCANLKGNKIAVQKGCSYFDWLLYVLNRCPDDGVKYRFMQTDAIEDKEVDNIGARANDGVPREERRAVNFTAYDGEEAERIKKAVYREYKHESATKLALKAVSSKLQTYFRPQQDEDDFTPRVLDDLTDKPVSAKTVSKQKDGATVLADNQIGTAYHKVLEDIDFDDKTLINVQNTIKRLVDDGELTQEVAEQLDCNAVLKVINLDIFSNLQNKKVYRELPFMLKTSYNNLFDDEKIDESVFLQGVLDMLILDGGTATIIDYKYTKSSEAHIKQNYQKQLNSYAQAVRQILKIDKVNKFVISIKHGKIIEF